MIVCTTDLDGQSWEVGYFHLGSVWVGPGDAVDVGQVLGTVGTSGRVDPTGGAHLHLQLREVVRGVGITEKWAVDPMPLLVESVAAQLSNAKSGDRSTMIALALVAGVVLVGFALWSAGR